MSMNTEYGFSEVVPGGTGQPLPRHNNVSLFASAVVMSHPLSKAANILALSGEYILSTPMASATSPSPARRNVVARLGAVDPEAQAFSRLTTGMPPIPMARNAI